MLAPILMALPRLLTDPWREGRPNKKIDAAVGLVVPIGRAMSKEDPMLASRVSVEPAADWIMV